MSSALFGKKTVANSCLLSLLRYLRSSSTRISCSNVIISSHTPCTIRRILDESYSWRGRMSLVGSCVPLWVCPDDVAFVASRSSYRMNPSSVPPKRVVVVLVAVWVNVIYLRISLGHFSVEEVFDIVGVHGLRVLRDGRRFCISGIHTCDVHSQ